MEIDDWGLGTGDWGLTIGDWRLRIGDSRFRRDGESCTLVRESFLVRVWRGGMGKRSRQRRRSLPVSIHSSRWCENPFSRWCENPFSRWCENPFSRWCE
ncbi:MAG: hypothetical protein JXQ75_20500, partial [Phycisphaerae bacterium]|nr:hypothetical protein [Phycisphaerae bacterium]